MLSNSPIYDAALIGLCISSVVLNCYALYLIIYITPQAMKDFRHCLCMLSIFDALFALFIGIVLIVSFTPPALAGVIRGPVIMFFYRNFGYNCCKGLVCVAFVSVCAILYFQNVAMRIRYLTINPNKKCYEWYNSKIGFTFVYTSGFVVSSVVGGSIYLHIFDEKDIPSMLATYPNSKTVFFDFIPGENILMAADPASPMCFFIIGFVSLCVLYVEINSYAMFFMARRLLRKHAANFSKQMFDLQQQFLYLVMIQVLL
uniref:G protein-coupled receptor n=1 Tax=Panagrellus redivivus TaxID=6233 RepID=A0A7E4VTD2_PANRE